MSTINKILITLLIFVFGVNLTSVSAQAATPRTATLLENTNLRDSAGYTKVVVVLKKNSQVAILNETVNWYQVASASGTRGWVIKWLVKPTVISVKASSSVTVASPVSSKLASSALASIISGDEINLYWQIKVNALRKAKGLRELAIQKTLIKTATEWADYLGQHNEVTHLRPDGKSPQQWIADKDIDFTKRNSLGGWKTNYFAENLGYRLFIKPTATGIKEALDGVLRMYLSEGPTGAHYRSIYQPDWNSFGAGWYPVKNAKGTYTLNFVFHYGSLVL
jgi:uncharacterized protein YkwD